MAVLPQCSAGAARKISPKYWLQETMTCHSSNCFRIVWGQGNSPLVTSLLSSCYILWHPLFFFTGIPSNWPSAEGLSPSTYKFSNLSSIHFLKDYLLERIWKKDQSIFSQSFLLMMYWFCCKKIVVVKIQDFYGMRYSLSAEALRFFASPAQIAKLWSHLQQVV